MKSIEQLIEASSLGTSHAKAMRASISDEDVQQVVRRSEALGRFTRFGFTEDQAWAMARADYDLFLLPVDRLFFDLPTCSYRDVTPDGGAR